MIKALKTLGVVVGLAVASAIDIAVLIGRLPVAAAACVAVVITVMVSTTKSSGMKTPRN
jgi:hypothetical protein